MCNRLEECVLRAYDPWASGDWVMHVAFKGRCCSHLLMAFRAGWLLELCLRDGAGDGPGDISPWLFGKEKYAAKRVA